MMMMTSAVSALKLFRMSLLNFFNNMWSKSLGVKTKRQCLFTAAIMPAIPPNPFLTEAKVAERR